MNDEKSESSFSRSYPADRLFNFLSRDPYKSLGDYWEKAVDRVDNDPSGAITAAKSLIEASCKHVLEKTGNAFDDSNELPKLYSEASRALSIAPVQQKNESYRAIFGSVHNIIQKVGELRNRAGDAHGLHRERYVTSVSEAELAVNLSGSIVLFLISTLETYLTLEHRIGTDGRLILWFDKTTVWRLVDHSRNAVMSERNYGKDVGPALLLVGDAGIYLASNGNPRLSDDGLLIDPEEQVGVRNLVVYADGCDPSTDEVERWWFIHNKIADGNDFAVPLPVKYFVEVLPRADTRVVIVLGEENFIVYPDVEFTKMFGSIGD